MNLLWVFLTFGELDRPGQRGCRAPACGAAGEAWAATTNAAFTKEDPVLSYHEAARAGWPSARDRKRPSWLRAMGPHGKPRRRRR